MEIVITIVIIIALSVFLAIFNTVVMAVWKFVKLVAKWSMVLTVLSIGIVLGAWLVHLVSQ